MELNQRENIQASPFEILTAIAFHLFNENEVDVGVVEVGMGGKLDATNILNNQTISVISKIARDHESFLGGSLEEIAQHKAGILRPNVPYIVNPVNEWNVQDVIDRYAKEIGAGPRLTADTLELREKLYSRQVWHDFAGRFQAFQRDNVVLAIVAVHETVKSLGLELSYTRAGEMLRSTAKAQNPGRLQYLKVEPVFGQSSKEGWGRHILVDGAHNPDAAKELDSFVFFRERRRILNNGRRPPQSGWPITWVIAMTEGRDARQYLEQILRPWDNIITTSFGPVEGMPWVKPMDPKKLLDIAKSIWPNITGLHMPIEGALRALSAAKYLSEEKHRIVLTGSLYLVGDLHRELRPRAHALWQTDTAQKNDRERIRAMHKEERHRVNNLLSLHNLDAFEMDRVAKSAANTYDNSKEKQDQSEKEKTMRLEEEIAALDSELRSLEADEQDILRTRSPTLLTQPSAATSSKQMEKEAMDTEAPAKTRSDQIILGRGDDVDQSMTRFRLDRQPSQSFRILKHRSINNKAINDREPI